MERQRKRQEEGRTDDCTSGRRCEPTRADMWNDLCSTAVSKSGPLKEELLSAQIKTC